MNMNRRTLFGCGVGAMLTSRLTAAIAEDKLEEAAAILSQATMSGKVRAAAIHVRAGTTLFSRSFGEAKSGDATFLLGSISKPISVAALMTLYDQGKFDLDDAVQKFIPEFTGGARNRVTLRHLLTHTSGLPDQLPNNDVLRAGHAPLSEFVKGAIAVPLGFDPGTRYEYSSMAIMLAAQIAHRLSGSEISELVQAAVLQPIGMHHSALGIGNLKSDEIMQAQVEFGAVESGGGSADSRTWDWNSSYWRQLGAPWGGVHASASDIGTFLQEFLHPEGKLFRPEVAKLMIRNHNPAGLESRGLGFDVGLTASCSGCSETTFGHTGSTGTIAWADPERDRICVVLTTLPGRALSSADHPRQRAAECVASID